MSQAPKQRPLKPHDTTAESPFFTHINSLSRLPKYPIPVKADQALAVCHLSAPQHLETLPASTRHIKASHDFLGQARARNALDVALSMPFEGYNVFAVGPSGVGKRTQIMRYLKEYAATQSTPQDWVYLNRFDEPRRPLALALPAGEGPRFRRELHRLWDSLFKQLKRVYGADRYQSRLDQIRQQANNVQQTALNQLSTEGEALSLRLVLQDEQHQFVALDEQQQVLTTQALDALADPKRSQLKRHLRTMQDKLLRLGERLEKIANQTQDQVTTLNHELANEVVSPRVQKFGTQWAHVAGLSQYLKQYALDIVTHVELILAGEEDEFLPGLFDRVPHRYQANLMVTHSPTQGAPVVFEDLPTHYNLLGHVEQLTQMGTITTDFTLIRPGALHRANGGFLVLDAEQLLEQPYAWQGLKRALRAQQLKLSSLEQMLTLTGSISLEPDAIPLQVKVVLLGDPDIYYELSAFDPELVSLFKIRADFADVLPRDAEAEQAYLGLIADFVQQEKLLPFEQSALALLLQAASREAEDQCALSLNASALGNLLRESHQHASTEPRCRHITAKHVQAALTQRQNRLGYLRELYWQDLTRGMQLIDTQGTRIGQINALTVVHHADQAFGLPSRLTASVSFGHGEILDIERTVELGGNLHAKGVLIMSSFLRAHFGRHQPLHFSAALAFEQNYGEIDGDSATLAEVCAILSALSGCPIDQRWGVTGSMNQLGQVQPIGGVNEKVEGFFDACVMQGLTGNQGVLIPMQNVQHLILRPDLVQAVADKRFSIMPVTTVDQAIEQLCGLPAGILNRQNRYPKASVYGRVQASLAHWIQLERGDLDKAERPARKANQKTSKAKRADR